MRALLSCEPAVGHLHPLVPLARALRDAGHEPMFAVSPSFCPTVEMAGFPAIPAGLDWLESDVDRNFPDLVERPRDLFSRRDVWPRIFARTGGAMLRDLVELLRSLRPDVVVGEATKFACSLAAEAAGIPHACVSIAAHRPLTAGGRAAGALAGAYDEARQQLGLPPDPAFERHCPYLYLNLYPPSLDRVPPDELPAVALTVRPEPYEVAAAEPPAWLDELSNDRPVVHVTMGTVFNRAPGAFDHVMEGLRDLDCHVVVTVGLNQEPSALGRVPENVRVERYIPVRQTLRHADVVVYHGGYNTSIAALAEGVPVVSIPFAADQLYNAFRLAACGAGLTLDRRELTAAGVGDAVSRVLATALYRDNAHRLGRELLDLPPVSSAVERLERLAVEGRPRTEVMR